ncbi:MAG: hypothetical protein HN844_07235 [Planctomycetes bacterium]|nr:hypothetical protein [Planctomycetota bacterium]
MKRFLAFFLVAGGCAVLLAIFMPQQEPEVDQIGPMFTAEQCAECHPAVAAEWATSHHALAYENPEVRRLSQEYRNQECIACHAPQPVLNFEPAARVLARVTSRTDGVSCLSCHATASGRIATGNPRPQNNAPCQPVFEPRMIDVNHCAACHNQHKTIVQWQATQDTDLKGQNCLHCHMVDAWRQGGRKGRHHGFPAAHDAEALKKAVELSANRTSDGQTQLVIRNSGCAHNFPTDERSRAADIQVRWQTHGDWGDWELVHRMRDPYRDEVSLSNSQLQPGETRVFGLERPANTTLGEARLLYRTQPFLADADSFEIARLPLEDLDERTLKVSSDLTAPDNTGDEMTQAAPYTRPDAQEIEHVADWLDAILMGGRVGASALDELAAQPDSEVNELLLTIGERWRDFPTDLRREAYRQLIPRATPAALPRLTLRLKYEKDWPSNVYMAESLYRLGSAQGLIAISSILSSEEQNDASILEAKEAAFSLLARLPDAPDLFEAQWEKLHLDIEQWKQYRSLRKDGLGSPELGPALRLELERLCTNFASQPLRPVDDARTVWHGLPARTYSVLIEHLSAKDSYVRNHVLQTMSWIGKPLSRWISTNQQSILTVLKPSIQDESTRVRALEALGACGGLSAAELALNWLASTDPEVATAAADALLQTALGQQREALTPYWLTPPNSLGPEALYSLWLLRVQLEGEEAAGDAPLSGLAPSEKARRDRWATHP